MPTLTAALVDSNGSDYNGTVSLVPLQSRNFLNSAGKLVVGRTISTTGAALRAYLEDPETETLVTVEGGTMYTMKIQGVADTTFQVPTEEGVYDITALLVGGLSYPPSFAAGWPSGGTAGQFLQKTGTGYGAVGWVTTLISSVPQVTSLPSSPTRGQVYELTQADSTAKAPPGFYIKDASDWFCLAYSALFDLGNLTGDLDLSLIAGAAYKAVITGDITTYAVNLSRTGIVSIYRSNASAFAVSQPTSVGRTQKLLSSTAWDDAAGDGVLDVLEDDGVNLISATSLLV